MDLLLLGGLSVGLLSVAAMAVAARAAHPSDSDDVERCQGCGVERGFVSAATEEALGPGRLALVCPVCGGIDPRLAWLDAAFWE